HAAPSPPPWTPPPRPSPPRPPPTRCSSSSPSTPERPRRPGRGPGAPGRRGSPGRTLLCTAFLAGVGRRRREPCAVSWFSPFARRLRGGVGRPLAHGRDDLGGVELDAGQRLVVGQRPVGVLQGEP